MKKKIIGILICMLVMTTAAVSAAGLMKKNIIDTDEMKSESVNSNMKHSQILGV